LGNELPSVYRFRHRITTGGRWGVMLTWGASVLSRRRIPASRNCSGDQAKSDRFQPRREFLIVGLP
jgi:hypothetical protein